MLLNGDPALLSVIADEMADVRLDIDDLSTLLVELTAHCPAEKRADAVRRTQACDLIIQRLDGLSGLMAALGAGVPWETALHALTLSDQSERLTGRSRPLAAPAESGDLMLFD
ncbi:MAG TPA: hypothetical protein VF633_14195 [Brevundimonas sp.]|jgi:hypothetical protein